ncbi:MAG: hypothetical protein EOS63_06840 [Mesorhizobium sp.]|uniref:hypothetical protein n=1 Tax=Mesorhizobium sp. TaxID=1871066 RepID=UPI000FE6B235|nr:hypothetical protein [Mesorhizobium sp.]RWE82525.1 MAG: hypothetical protein EOS63_06840 [Mesorhizobium sp.]TJW65116.1 MAG: hypothetical protein E5V97_03795 [Mesorhizobium sp.]
MERLDEDTRKQRETVIAGQYGGIYPPYEAFYIQSIIYAADRSETAFKRFDEADALTAPAGLIFATVQEALTHAGALSRFFWPVKKDSQLAAARGKRLREAFKLDDTSPLKWRNLRNAFEHFDEDLDRFLLEDRVGYFFPGPVVDDQALTEETLGQIFKLVDPPHAVCVLLGQRFEFRPIRREVQRVLARAIEMDNAGARL